MEKVLENNEKIFVAKTVEEVKMIFDPIRFRIIKTLFDNKSEMTVKQIAEAIDEAANKVHYHVSKLYKYGALDLVRTENINGIIAKYYFTKYHGYVLDPEGGGKEVYDITRNALYINLDMAVNKFKKDMVSYMALIEEHGKKAQRGLDIGYFKLYMTKEEKVEAMKKIKEVLKPYMEKNEEKEVYTTIQTLARIK